MARWKLKHKSKEQEKKNAIKIQNSLTKDGKKLLSYLMIIL